MAQTHTLDRLTAAKYGDGAVTKLSSEAQVVANLNDAAVHSPTINPNGLHIHSTVPNLIYLPHQWSQDEKQSYLQLSTGGRFVFIQAQLPQLNQDVVPINLVMHPRGNYETRYNLSWPTRSLAATVILYSVSGGRFQISAMMEWAAIASRSADGNTYTVQFYRNNQPQHQKYHETANAIGKKLDVGGILAEIREKVPPFSGPECDDRTLPWLLIKGALAHEAGGTVAGGLPTRPKPPGRESTSHTLPTGQMLPPTSAGESSRQAQARLVPRPDDRSNAKPPISPSTVFIQNQLAFGAVSDEHYDSKVNTSPTKKRRVPLVIELED